MTRSAVILAVFTFLVVACTSGDESSSPTEASPTTIAEPTATTSTLPQTDALEDFRSCLVSFDVEIDPIELDGQGRPRLDLAMASIDYSDPAVIDAVAECSLILSSGALDLSGAPVIGQAVVDVLAEFSVCVRSQGVPDFPDPVPGFIGIGAPYPAAEIPFADPDLESAIDECSRRLAATE